MRYSLSILKRNDISKQICINRCPHQIDVILCQIYSFRLLLVLDLICLEPEIKNERVLNPKTPDTVTWRCSMKKSFRNFAKFTRKHLRQILFFLIKLQASASNFIKKESLAQVFSCTFYKTFMNTFLYNNSGWLPLKQPLVLTNICFSLFFTKPSQRNGLFYAPRLQISKLLRHIKHKRVRINGVFLVSQRVGFS